MILVPILIYPAIFLISGDAIAQLLIKKTSSPIEISFIQVSPSQTAISSDLIGLKEYIQKNLSQNDTQKIPKKKINLEYTFRPIFVAQTAPPLITGEQIQLIFYPVSNSHKKGEIQIFFNSENDLAFTGKNQLQYLIEDYNMILFKRLLQEKNISIEMMQPIVIRESQNISPSEHSVIKYGGALLAILLIFLTYVSCQYAATEVIPAEREQQTLETLLSTPLQWHDIIIGKYLSIAVAGIFNAILNLTGMLIFGGSIISSMANLNQESFQFHISFYRVIMILLSLIPLAFMCGAVSMFLISFARTRMSASYFSVPGMLLVITPAMLTLMPNTALQGVWILLPFANMTLYIRSLILGDVSFLTSLAVLSNVSIFSIVITVFSISISNQKDKVLSGGINFSLFHKPKTIQESLSIFEGVFIFAISLILYFTLGQIVTSYQPLAFLSIPLSFFLCFFLPSYLFMKFKNINMIKFLDVYLPTWQQVLGAVLFIIPLLFITQIFAGILSLFIPEIADGELMKKLILDFKSKYGMTILILVFAVTPGIFEEFIMRGILFQSIKKQLKPIIAIILTGLIFSFIHGFLRMFPLIPAGILLTWLMFRTKSILIPIIVHTLFNSTSLLLSEVKTDSAEINSFVSTYPIYFYIIILIVVVLSFFSYHLLTKHPHKNANET